MRENNPVPLWMTVAFLTAMLALLAGGAWFFHDQERQQRQQVENRLMAIARLKANQIAEWRAERLADAAVLVERRALLDSVVRFLSTPTQQEASEILRRFRSVKERYNYADILLVDPRKRVRLSLSGKVGFHEGYAATLDAAVVERKPVWTPLHVESGYPFPHISVVAPFFARQDAREPVGALVLVSDATQFLYPLIQSWPTPSKTAETLLVRREGNDVVFLNELRHQKNTALKLRIPVSRASLPAAMAVAGKKGIVEGEDYRGVEVVAAILPIQESPWFMVAKIDDAEAFAEWRFRSLMILGLILGLLVLVVVAGLVVRQRNSKVHYRALYQFESALRASMERHSITLQAIGDAVISADAKGRVEFLNPVAETLTGWSQEEALGKSLSEVFPIINEETRRTVEDPVAKVLREGQVVGLANHTLLLARDGRKIPIADSGAPIRDGKGEILGVVLVFRDQSEERMRERLTETRLALIEHAEDHSLDEFLARALDEVGALVNSPIGFYHFVKSDQKTISLQQWSTHSLNSCRAEGKGMHYSIDQAGVWADCVYEKKPVIHNDYASLPHRKGMPDGHSEVVRELVVPVMREDKVVAILGVGNKPADYTEKDVEIVSHLADTTWEIVRRKWADHALSESEKRFRQIFENIGAGIAIYEAAEDGKDFVFKDINPAGARIGQKEREEHLGKSVLEIYPGVRKLGLFDIFQEVWRRGTSRQYPISQYQDDRIAIWVENYVCKLPSGEVMAVYEDMTESKQAEEALQLSLEKYEKTFQTVPVWVVLSSFEEGRYLEVNEAFLKTMGCKREEVIGKTSLELNTWVDPQDRAHIMTRLKDKKEVRNLEVRRMTRSGKIIDTLFSAEILSLAGKQVMISVTQEISELKQAEEEREKLQAQLLQAQKMESVGRLAGGVAHDFNNMLGVIMGRTEMILMGMTTGDPNYANLEEIQKAARRSADLTRQLLAFARRQTIAPVVLDLNDTVEGMLKMLRRLIGEDIDLLWKPDSHLWSVMMDPIQIDQILANLCVNARDAIAGVGKVTIETESVVLDDAYCGDHAGFVPGEYVTLAVSDDGCGMDKETLDKIFEPFFTTKEVGKGTGLGLATIYGIVKQNNGFVNVYSEPGKGTTFRIYIPRHEGDAVEEAAASPVQVPHGQGETIFLVEDDPGILSMGKMMLERLGYKVLTAGDPGQALNLAKEYKGRIHLLMSDVVMPQMSGKDLAGQLQTVVPQIKVLYMSGYTANAIAHHGVLDAGVNFIQKPFSLVDLARRVREALNRYGVAES